MCQQAEWEEPEMLFWKQEARSLSHALFCCLGGGFRATCIPPRPGTLQRSPQGGRWWSGTIPPRGRDNNDPGGLRPGAVNRQPSLAQVDRGTLILRVSCCLHSNLCLCVFSPTELLQKMTTQRKLRCWVRTKTPWVGGGLGRGGPTVTVSAKMLRFYNSAHRLWQSGLPLIASICCGMGGGGLCTVASAEWPPGSLSQIYPTPFKMKEF